jgi:hypothetical protein
MFGSTLESDSARSSNKNGFHLADRGETDLHSRQQHGYYHKPSKLLKQRWNGSKSDQYSSEIKIVLQPELIKI